MNRKKLIVMLITIFYGFILYAESIDDIYDIATLSNKVEFTQYLSKKGLEQYNTKETNGNVYFQPKSGKTITFYDMEIINIILLYNRDELNFKQINVVVKNIGNESKARKVKSFIANKYQLNNTTDTDYFKNEKYSFMFYEYPDITYGYIRFSFSKR